MRRPTAPMVLSSIALFAALGGTGYAAGKISGKDIKANSVTGLQVKESTLGTVRRATVAKSAKALTPEAATGFVSAKRFVSTDGVIKQKAGAPAQTVLEAGPFTLTMECKKAEFEDEETGETVTGGVQLILRGRSKEPKSLLAGPEPATTALLRDPSYAADAPDVTADTFRFLAPSGATLNIDVTYGGSALGTDCFVSADGLVGSGNP